VELYLVRHPETTAPKGLCYGRTDYPLKYSVEETGKKTMADLPDSFDHMVVSPAPRAQKLANYLLSDYQQTFPANKEYETDKRITEMDFGDWEDKYWDDLPKKDTMPWMKDFVNRRTPNGEAFTDLIARVTLFLEDWKPKGVKNQDWSKQNGRELSRIIVVCHSGPIRALLCLINSKPFEEAFKMPIEFGSVQKLEL